MRPASYVRADKYMTFAVTFTCPMSPVIAVGDRFFGATEGMATHTMMISLNCSMSLQPSKEDRDLSENCRELLDRLKPSGPITVGSGIHDSDRNNNGKIMKTSIVN